MRFEDFVLQLDSSSQGEFRARVLKSPFGEGGVRFSLPTLTCGEPVLHNGDATSRDICHQRTTPNGEGSPLRLGTELYSSVFQGQVRTLLDKCRGQLEVSQDLGLRLKIKLDPGDEETGALADLPWELLYDGETEDFFVLSRQMSIVRYLDVPRPAQPIPFTPPLRILAVAASPQGLQPLDLQRESRRLEELNERSPGIDIQFLARASVGAVREALSGDTFHVLHFMGHGTFDRVNGEGMLVFEKSNGAADLVSGKAFATKLRDRRSLGVVMLNACETARACHQRGASPFRGVATALVLGGIPAVVAMQRPISDTAAIGFSGAFYRHLARGASIDEALTEGRQAIHSANPDGFEWATPVLFLRLQEGNLFIAKPAGPQPGTEPNQSIFSHKSSPEAHPSQNVASRPSERQGTWPKVACDTRIEVQASEVAFIQPDEARRECRTSKKAISSPSLHTQLQSEAPANAKPKRPEEPLPGEKRLNEKDGTVLLYVPGGDLTLGADGVHPWSRPVHRVRITPFWIGRLLVTNQQYARFLEENTRVPRPAFWDDQRFNRPEHPVVGVSWDDAQAYCRWAGLNLPTEAEWEIAARGHDLRPYPWGKEPPTPRHANFDSKTGGTTPVGAFPAGIGPYGALDQAGNVWEWCADPWASDAYELREQGEWNPIAKGDTAVRALRGGSWINPAQDLHTAYRGRGTAKLRRNHQGFRCIWRPT